MSKVGIKLNKKGVRDLMMSEEMMSICKEYASQIQAKAGAGYEISPYVGKNRVNVSVYPATPEAVRDNYEHNTLLKARGGGK